MIDGTEFFVNGTDAERLWNNPLLNSKEAKEYDGLIIKKTKFGCYVSGSLHKFKNGGLHNADDFTYSDFCDTLVRIRSELGINTKITVFNGLELE